MAKARCLRQLAGNFIVQRTLVLGGYAQEIVGKNVDQKKGNKRNVQGYPQWIVRVSALNHGKYDVEEGVGQPRDNNRGKADEKDS